MDRIGRYKIVRELGRGAMGVVYHAIDPNIGRPVAIKTIRIGGKPEEQDRLRERLFREARSAGALSHPGIVTVYDVEQQDDLAYIAMEYVDGPTLDQLLTPDSVLPPERIFSVLAQTAAALDYAHQKGIVHRDVKPANVMIAAEGTVKITDFGIAKITASEQFTMTGTIVGTPHYMSPEQVQGQQVDGRSDQFSLAVMAFELLTGEKPYTGEHLTTVVYKIVAEEPLSPHRLNPTLSPAIETVLRRGLAKKPEARYGSCQEFVDALEKACGASRGWKPMPRGGSLSEPTVGVAAAAVPSMPPSHRALHGDTTMSSESPRKRRSGFLAFLAAILMAAALLALIGWQTDPDLPHKVQGLSERIQAAIGLAPAAQQPAAAKGVSAPAGTGPQQATAPSPAATPEEPKPSPMPQQSSAAAPEQPPGEALPPATAPASEPKLTAAMAEKAAPVAEGAARPEQPPRVSPAPRKALPPAGPLSVTVTSSPAGATATLDGRPESSCSTPCSLEAPPGKHSIVFTLAGYQPEHRDLDVGSAAMELPPVVLRAPSGTLMLTSVPDGAAVSVNGRKLPHTTPAQIPLAPGIYRVTVEKDGKQATSSVEIRDTTISYLRVTLN